VTAMHAYWILPNRDQRDDVLASDGRTTVPLRQILDPRTRPQGFSHGVPAELLEKCGAGALTDILFAQKFPDGEGGKQLFSVFSTAGSDGSGRVVHLGLLFLLEPYERPQFELPYSSLSEPDQVFARTLIQRLRSQRDVWARSVLELSELSPGYGPATNVALERSAVRFYGLYDAGPSGLTRKRAMWRTPFAASILCWHWLQSWARRFPSEPVSGRYRPPRRREL
jgi:hypothetical protein